MKRERIESKLLGSIRPITVSWYVKGSKHTIIFEQKGFGSFRREIRNLDRWQAYDFYHNL